MVVLPLAMRAAPPGLSRVRDAGHCRLAMAPCGASYSQPWVISATLG